MNEWSDYGEKHVSMDKVEAIDESDAAVRVRFEDGTRTWIPKSQIGEDSEVYEKGHDGILVVTRWFAEQRGWA